MNNRVCTCLAALCVILCQSSGSPADDTPPVVRIGSKDFNEGAILGELAVQLVEDSGAVVDHQPGLVANVLWKALLADEIDLYPEYTGTLMREVLQTHNLQDVEQLRHFLRERGLRMSASLGFSNSYALGMKQKRAAALGISTISDLANDEFADLKFGFGNEFMQRNDCWPSLQPAYGLPQPDVAGLEHALAYVGLSNDRFDVIDVYTTDAEIQHYDLVALQDDRNHFPLYEAIWIYRAELEDEAPAAIASIKRLEGRIDEAKMIAMNRRAKIDRVLHAQVAADFLSQELGFAKRTLGKSLVQRLAETTFQHLTLVTVSLSAAILLAIPLGIFSVRSPRIGRVVLSVVGVVQTIPSVALLVLLIPLLGIGGPPAIVALFLYSLLPIVQNTYAGLQGIAPGIRESAKALGLPPMTRLTRIELPMASRSILAGIKTSAVINVGTATLGGFIGAGGYGEPIFAGIRQNDNWLLLEGAVPAAALALLLQFLFDVAERWAVPRGLRLQPH